MRIQRDEGGPIPKSYRRLLIEYRRKQLEATGANVTRIEKAFDRAIKEVATKVRNSSDGGIAQAYFTHLLADLDATLTRLRGDYSSLLMAGMADSAQIAADRESATAALVGAPADASLVVSMSQSYAISSGATVTVQFGQVAMSAVERTASRVYSDGWQLSDRLYNLDLMTRTAVQDTLVQGVAEQISARAMAKRLITALGEAGGDNPRYNAMRIARTEIVTAHREAHILSTMEPGTNRLKDYILGVGWRLSVSHPHIDICDIWADDDGDSLGNGNYLPENVPSDHPHGLCYTVSVLKDYPDVAAPSKDAEAEEVSETQAAYYAEKYDDPTAIRWLAKRGAT